MNEKVVHLASGRWLTHQPNTNLIWALLDGQAYWKTISGFMWIVYYTQLGYQLRGMAIVLVIGMYNCDVYNVYVEISMESLSLQY